MAQSSYKTAPITPRRCNLHPTKRIHLAARWLGSSHQTVEYRCN
ncbi:Uncharacterised protein [Vibrio cholerae]|nr:Uncharacterised protein [Vibrio cholerae]